MKNLLNNFSNTEIRCHDDRVTELFHFYLCRLPMDVNALMSFKPGTSAKGFSSLLLLALNLASIPNHNDLNVHDVNQWCLSKWELIQWEIGPEKLMKIAGLPAVVFWAKRVIYLGIYKRPLAKSIPPTWYFSPAPSIRSHYLSLVGSLWLLINR